MARKKRLSWSQAIADGLVTPKQARDARLTPPAVRYVPEPLTPQDLLTEAVSWRWPGEVRTNYRPVLGDHNFELDIAFPALRLGIEVDGWQFHGKHKAGFLRDRKKDRLLLLAGWRVFRFAASEVLRDMPLVLSTIQEARGVCEESPSS